MVSSYIIIFINDNSIYIMKHKIDLIQSSCEDNTAKYLQKERKKKQKKK